MQLPSSSSGGKYRYGILLVLIYLFLTGFFALIYFASGAMEISIEKFTADPITTFDSHPFVGIVSNLGILFWCSTAAVSLFSYFFLKGENPGKSTSFLLWSGLLTTMLMLDDLFMFHDYLAIVHLNFPQEGVYAVYFILALAWFIIFRKEIMRSEFMVFLLAGFFLSSSVLGDFILPQEGIAYMFEDAFKFFGIVTWAIFFISASWIRLKEKSVIQTSQ